MELADNGTVLLFPGALDATLSDALCWVSLALSFAIAFLVTTPVNKWMIGRGRGTRSSPRTTDPRGRNGRRGYNSGPSPGSSW